MFFSTRRQSYPEEIKAVTAKTDLAGLNVHPVDRNLPVRTTHGEMFRQQLDIPSKPERNPHQGSCSGQGELFIS